MDFPNQDELLAQCEQIFTSAGKKISGEAQLELNAEVEEGVKYELAQVSWVDRLSADERCVTIGTTHQECRSITGTIEQVSPSLLVLGCDSFRFLVNPRHIVWLQGLNERASVTNQQPLDQFAFRLWLQHLCESRIESLWFLADGSSVMGVPIRLLADAIDVTTQIQSLTFPLRHICAIRLPR
jgi:hypothetical protein